MIKKTDDIISMAESLPIDIKTQLIDNLLSSLNPTQKAIEEIWAKEADKRIEEIRTGKVKPVPGEEVFKEIRDKLFK